MGKKNNPNFVATSNFEPATIEDLTSKKELTFHNFDPEDRKGWLALRTQLTGMEGLADIPRFGGSECAVIFNLSKYKSANALYYERLFLKPIISSTNLHTYRGICLEDTIIEKYWKYYNPNKYDMNSKEIKNGDILKNADNGKIVREAIALHSTVLNENYPHLLANVDSLIVEGELGVLEIKSMFKTAAEQWSAGVDPSHVIQLQTYLLVLGLDYGEIFMLLDATEPRCIRMRANKEIQQNIIDRVSEFGKSVAKARKEIVESDGEEETIWDIAAKYEPDPDFEQTAYVQFLKEIYRSGKGSMVASEEIEEHLIAFSKAKVQIGELTKDVVTPAEANIRKEFVDNNLDEIVTSNGTKVRWRSRLSIPYKKVLGL